MKGRLCTAGYERRDADDFVGLLRGAGVSLLVDVREVAWSRRSDFTKRALATRLEQEGIGYVHAGFAGNPSGIRRSGGSAAAMLARYAAHLVRHPEVMEAFESLVMPELKAGRVVCLMCRERDPSACHRGVLAALWESKHAGAVEHLGVEHGP